MTDCITRVGTMRVSRKPAAVNKLAYSASVRSRPRVWTIIVMSLNTASVSGPLSGGSTILHDWEDARCAQILTSCRAAVSGGAKLLLVESSVGAWAPHSSALVFGPPAR